MRLRARLETVAPARRRRPRLAGPARSAERRRDPTSWGPPARGEGARRSGARVSSPALLALIAGALGAALLAAGCGGGGSGGSSSTTPPAGGGAPGGGTSKQATAPNAPAGSKVLACRQGESGMEGLRATAVDCGLARATMREWSRSRACALPAEASRGSCSLDGFRCQAVRTDRGVAVSCARPGGALTFIQDN